MYTEVEGRYGGNAFGELISDNGLSANLYHKGDRAFKVFNAGYDKGIFFDEVYAMAKAEQLGLPVPAVYAAGEKDGHWYIEMDYAEGEVLMMQVIGAAVSGNYGALDEAMMTLAKVQYEVHSKEALRFVDFSQGLRAAVAEKESLTQEQKAFVLERLESLPSGTKLVHGDFQPFNVIMGGNGPVIIDWADAGAGVPACDVARTYLNFSYPTIPELTKPEVAMAERYFRAYRELSGITFEEIRQWFPVMAALSVGRDPVFSAHMQKYMEQAFYNHSSTKE